MPIESDSPQAIDPCELHAQESQRLQPDRFMLTDAEREAIHWAAYACEQASACPYATTLRGLLERTRNGAVTVQNLCLEDQAAEDR